MLKIVCRLVLLFSLTGMLCNASRASDNHELDNYLQTIAAKCRKAYFQVPLWETGIVSESFILNSDGSASQIKILVHPKKYKTMQTSAAADAALILAVKNAVPFAAPPVNLHTPTKLILTINGTGIGHPLKATVDLAKD